MIVAAARATRIGLGEVLPGLLLVAAVTACAFGLRQFPLVATLSPMIAAIVVGMLFHNLVGCPESTRAGIAFAGRKLLRLAVALLGLQLTFGELALIGWSGFLVLVLSVASTFAFTLFVGRLLGVDRGLTELIAAGTSICGASAIGAANAVCRASDEDVSYAIASITLFGTLAMVFWPALMVALDLDPVIYGLWVGASVHEVAQVAGAAFQGGAEAGRIGVVSKLARVLLLAPAIVVLAMLVARRTAIRPSEHTDASPPMVPIFVVGFVALVALNSAGIVPEAPRALLVGVTPVLLTAALGALGLGTSVAKLRARGMRPLVLGGLASIWIAVISLSALLLVG